MERELLQNFIHSHRRALKSIDTFSNFVTENCSCNFKNMAVWDVFAKWILINSKILTENQKDKKLDGSSSSAAGQNQETLNCHSDSVNILYSVCNIISNDTKFNKSFISSFVCEQKLLCNTLAISPPPCPNPYYIF